MERGSAVGRAVEGIGKGARERDGAREGGRVFGAGGQQLGRG